MCTRQNVESPVVAIDLLLWCYRAQAQSLTDIRTQAAPHTADGHASSVAIHAEFDVPAQSYYPWWQGTLDDLKANLTDLAGRYKQDIIVVEYAAPHIREINEIVHGLPLSSQWYCGRSRRST